MTRIVFIFVAALALAVAAQARALETTAGAQSVQASQMGLDAKIDASNSALTAAYNLMNTKLTKVLNCNASKQFYDAATDSCVAAAGAGGGVTSMVVKQCSDGSNANGACVTPSCPAGYFLSGCSYGYGNSAYISFGPASGNTACQCGKSHGAGKLTCTAYCVK